MREKVAAAARELGLDVNVRTLGVPTRTVEEAARAVGCADAQIAKSIVVVCDGDPVVCITSGAHRIEIGRVCEALDCAEVRMASPGEVRAATGFSVGGVPPFGHGLPVLFDAALLEHERIWAAGGDGSTLFEIDARRLAECSAGQVVPLGS